MAFLIPCQRQFTICTTFQGVSVASFHVLQLVFYYLKGKNKIRRGTALQRPMLRIPVLVEIYSLPFAAKSFFYFHSRNENVNKILFNT
uniref:Uncharacterized protein n=1 Tax=Anguilla anguilla TaxID=7936 RepID=A0A0E9X620_ANGAN